MMHMDIFSHSPIPLAQNNFPVWHCLSNFSTVFWVLNFDGHFEALNDVFWDRRHTKHIRFCISQFQISTRIGLSNGLLSDPNRDCM